MDEIEQLLRERMIDATRICQRELRWNPTAATQMINEHGAAEAAHRMVLTEGGTDGYARCWEENRLDLSVEAIIADPIFAPLFTDEVLTAARERLEEGRRNPPRRNT